MGLWVVAVIVALGGASCGGMSGGGMPWWAEKNDNPWRWSKGGYDGSGLIEQDKVYIKSTYIK